MSTDEQPKAEPPGRAHPYGVLVRCECPNANRGAPCEWPRCYPRCRIDLVYTEAYKGLPRR